jgi:hypothetical protein
LRAFARPGFPNEHDVAASLQFRPLTSEFGT